MIQSLQELKELADKKKCNQENNPQELRVCAGSSCLSLGSAELQSYLEDELQSRELKDSCRVKSVGCSGLCANGTLVSHCQGDTKNIHMYERITTSDVKSLLDNIQNNTILKNKVCDTTQAFFTSQTKIVLENAGSIDPDDIEDYIAHGGYLALLKALDEMSPKQVIDEIKSSGLRGRGGGGYPTGIKWESVSKVISKQKYIICNGDEGDPGAFMDRAVMESDPHRVIEGMAIAGYACGADKGYIYVRAEYPLALEKLEKAIKQANKLGLLGDNIAHSNFNFNIEVRLGAGAFVCGEATALVASIEGERGNPRQKPPHLSNYGLWGEPTLLNNVETLANITSIIKNSGEWYSAIGTESSSGTKVFALTGHIQNSGLIEVPMGTTLREVVYEIGGGVANGKKFKAIQSGGPSGGCIPEHLLDLSIDYDSLKDVGSIMGSGGLIVIDESSNMVEIARFFIDFCRSESCGKCTPCRVGTVHLRDLLDKFIAKEATANDFELLKEMCDVVKSSSLCGLGQTAPNPILSTIRYFEDEYLAGIKND